MKRLAISGSVDRVEYLKALCLDKVVLHLGCANAGLTEQKISDGSLLYLALGSVAQAVYGVDLDARSIEIMRLHGIRNLFEGDCEHLDQLGLIERFDVLLAVNMFNYLPNPDKFLEAANTLLKPDAELVVSIDNIYSIKKLLRCFLMHREMIHPSQLWNASPASLDRMLSHFGFAAIELCGFWAGPDIFGRQTLKSKSANRLFARLPWSPNYADGLIVRAQLVSPVI